MDTHLMGIWDECLFYMGEDTRIGDIVTIDQKTGCLILWKEAPNSSTPPLTN